VQVAALRGRPEADQIVQRLIEKGYDAYVVDPVPGAPAAVYRVRVGRSLARQDAEEMLRRLETQEQFKPWITR
jgi:cell division septation protein DedD